ncbi:MAG TPA: hypothetical protein VGV15_21140 [Terriglobales bacterium]|nr:hypothetical protein [Terriglobales bacterium]
MNRTGLVATEFHDGLRWIWLKLRESDWRDGLEAFVLDTCNGRTLGDQLATDESR